MKSTTQRLILGFSSLAAVGLLIAGCSNASDKAGIPPVNKIEKVKNSVQHDTFTQGVDILFVVDDSASMDNHQSNLASNIALFTAQLGKTKMVDYHIGVVTTSMDHSDPTDPYDPNDPWGSGSPCDNTQVPDYKARACGDGKLVRWKTHVPFVDRNTPNGLQVLTDNLLVGTKGSSEEHLFDPVYAALSAPRSTNENAGFFRSGASLAIIFLSDAEDQSDAPMDAQYLYNFLTNLKGGRVDQVTAYGVLVPSSDSDPSCPRDAYDTPQRVESFIGLTHGQEFNICDADYGTKLATIAKDVVSKVSRVMYLSRLPVVDTISVTYGSQVIPNDKHLGWTYDPVRNALVFGDKLVYTPQPAGSQIEVNFTAGKLSDAK